MYAPRTSRSSAPITGMFTAFVTSPPSSAAATCSATMTPARSCASSVDAARCGVTTTLSSSSSGPVYGSSEKTSSAAPATVPLRPASLLQCGVRLRNVAGERDEEADRVLGGGDDGRLGRVGHDDPAPCRCFDVDVVHSHARAPDHLEPDRACDQIAGQLRRRANDDRVVVCDSLRELGIKVDVDVETVAQQLDSGSRDLLADEDALPGHTCARSAYASSARVTPTPRSTSAPASASTSSSAASAVTMSNTSNQPMCPIRKIFPFSSP